MNFDPLQIKLAVIKAAAGINALDEPALLRRLEDLFIEGAKMGADLMHQRSVEVLTGKETHQQRSGE